MTASKSSRARNARTGAQAGAARGGTAVKNGNAARGGTAKSAGTAKPAGIAARDRNARDQARNGAARSGAARRGAAARGPRTIEVSDAPAERGPAPWLQITTFVLALAGLGVSI